LIEEAADAAMAEIGTAACADSECDQAGPSAWLRMHIDHGVGDPARDRWDVSRRTAR